MAEKMDRPKSPRRRAEQVDPAENLQSPKLRVGYLQRVLADWSASPSPGARPSAKPDFSAAYAIIDARLAELRNDLRRAVRLKYAAEARWAYRLAPRGKFKVDWDAKVRSVMRPDFWYTAQDIRLRVGLAYGLDKKATDSLRQQLKYLAGKGTIRRTLTPRAPDWKPNHSGRGESKWVYALPEGPDGGSGYVPIVD